jgi:hypothetical protein
MYTEKYALPFKKLWNRIYSVLLVEETVVSRENHPPAASTPCHEFELTTLVVIGTDCIGSCKSNFHTIMTMMTPPIFTIKSVWG